MGGQPCAGCGANVIDRYACTGCAEDLRDRLHQVRALAEELDVTLTRQAVIAADGSGALARSAEQPLVFSWPASEAIVLLELALDTWTHTLATARGLTVAVPTELRPIDPRDPARIQYRRARSAALAAWLAEHAELVTVYPDAGTCLDEIDFALRTAWAVVDRPPERRFAGPCWAETEDEHGQPIECTADLYGHPHAVTVECRLCGTEHGVDERRAWLLDAARHQLLTATEASRALPGLLGRDVTASMIRNLAARDQITKHPPLPGARAPLYQVGQLIDALVADEADAAIARGRRRG